MPFDISRERGRQSATSRGFGQSFATPPKKRNPRKRNNAMATNSSFPDLKRRRLELNLEQLMAGKPLLESDLSSLPPIRTERQENLGNNSKNNSTEVPEKLIPPFRTERPENLANSSKNNSTEVASSLTASEKLKTANNEPEKKPRRCVPNRADWSLHDNWNRLLPTLVDCYLEYTSLTLGKDVPIAKGNLSSEKSCRRGKGCLTKSSTILCLYSHSFVKICVTGCECQTISQTLVKNGLFPTAPTDQARMAVSIALMDFYSALFEQSSHATKAISAGLYSHYRRRGMYIQNEKSQVMKEPFRRPLGSALQWMDCLRVLVEDQVQAALQSCDQGLQSIVPYVSTSQTTNPPSKISQTTSSPTGLSQMEMCQRTTQPTELALDRGLPLQTTSLEQQISLYQTQFPWSLQSESHWRIPLHLTYTSFIQTDPYQELGFQIPPSQIPPIGMLPSESTPFWPIQQPALEVQAPSILAPWFNTTQTVPHLQGSTQLADILPFQLPLTSAENVWTRPPPNIGSSQLRHPAQPFPISNHFTHNATPSPAPEAFQTAARPLQVADSELCKNHHPTQKLPPLPNPDHCTDEAQPMPENLTECAQILRQLCPACFGANKFGRSLLDGGDFQVSTDGNFHHRHVRTAGKGIPFHRPKHIIPKSFVDQVGSRIEAARKSPPCARTPKVPDSAVDECEKSHEAADEDKSLQDPVFDEKGWMSLICRHDVPLFFASIDTPGEKQKYSVALLLYFITLIPSWATVVLLYDIACVLHRSLQLFDILPASIVDRVLFVTTAMHAYAHQWSCQLAYNPRLCKGLGLTDGEGVERTWSKLYKLIPIVRRMSAARRIWTTDRQLSAIALELRDDLGDWLIRRQKSIDVKSAEAKAVLEKCDLSITELRRQWDLQKEDQLSIRAHAPKRIKKELDSVLALQSQLEEIEAAIKATKKSLGGPAASPTGIALTDLQNLHQNLSEKAESLYVSLNLEDFPDLKGVKLEFVRYLLMAHDLKINIRKRAIGGFYELDRLDQAVGGKDQPLGTKLHQRTRAAIAKRRPGLMSAVKKFNRYCEKLSTLYDPEWNIPLPSSLPVTLDQLRDKSSLAEDVYLMVSESTGDPPLWLDDKDIRLAIRAMLKLDRCNEEQDRIKMEADNLCRWFGREISAVELALRTPAHKRLSVPLAQYRDALLHLKSRWGNNLVLPNKLEAHVLAAQEFSSGQTGCKEPEVYKSFRIATETEGLEGATAEYFAADDDLEGNKIAKEIDDDEVMELEPGFFHDKQDADDTSGIEYVEGSMTLIWQLPKLDQDDKLLDFITDTVVVSPSRKLVTKWRFASHEFEAKEMQLLDSSNGLLNDICINGLVNLLQDLFSKDPKHHHRANDFAIFNTHDLLRVRCKAADTQLWKHTCLTEYWKKTVWIIPINRVRQRHWVLAVVYIQRGEVHLYDSLAGGKNLWKEDVQDIAILISRLTELSRRNGHGMAVLPEKWRVQPTVSTALQTNEYDCGLWVLAWIAAILRGGQSLSLSITEKMMVPWRRLLSGLIRTHSTPNP